MTSKRLNVPSTHVNTVQRALAAVGAEISSREVTRGAVGYTTIQVAVPEPAPTATASNGWCSRCGHPYQPSPDLTLSGEPVDGFLFLPTCECAGDPPVDQGSPDWSEYLARCRRLHFVPGGPDDLEPKPDPDVDGVRLACVDAYSWSVEQRPGTLPQSTWEEIFGALVMARALGSIGCTTTDPDTGLVYTSRRRVMPQGARSPRLWDIFLTSAPADATAPESHCGHDACAQRRTCLYR